MSTDAERLDSLERELAVMGRRVARLHEAVHGIVGDGVTLSPRWDELDDSGRVAINRLINHAASSMPVHEGYDNLDEYNG